MDVTFVEDQAYNLRGDLDASLKGEEKSQDVLLVPFTSESSSETFAPTSRGFLEPYKQEYSRREKTQLPLDKPNDQSVAPITNYLMGIPSPKISTNTLKEST